MLHVRIPPRWCGAAVQESSSLRLIRTNLVNTRGYSCQTNDTYCSAVGSDGTERKTRTCQCALAQTLGSQAGRGTTKKYVLKTKRRRRWWLGCLPMDLDVLSSAAAFSDVSRAKVPYYCNSVL